MTHRRRVVSPRIVPPPRYGLRVLVFSLLLLLVGAAVGVAFFAGIQLEREASVPLVDEIGTIEQERDALSAEVADLKQQMIVLERSQQIDREANKTAAEQLKEAQDERLAAEKEVSFLRRLIQEGGGGILQPRDFELEETGEPGEFGYSFTIRQLIPDFGESTGTVDVKVTGRRGDNDVTLPLDRLKGSEPARHEMAFKHFQSFEGSIQVPGDFEPESLVVEIKPKSAKLIPVSETFPWSTE
jgi:cell division protein FtsB